MGNLKTDRVARAKIVFFDVDGVFTDGKAWQDSSGQWRRSFSVRDTMGVRALRKAGLVVVVLTAAVSDEIRSHFDTVGVDAFKNGCLDRDSAMDFILKSRGLTYDDALIVNEFHRGFVGLSFHQTAMIYSSARQSGDGAVLEISNLILQYGAGAHAAPARVGSCKLMAKNSFSRKRLVLSRLFLFATLLFFALLLSPRPVFAASKQVIQFPEEELASESVLPVFDRNEAVKNRIVSTAKRVELGIFGTYAMTEAFYNPFSVGGMLSYHFNETHGVNLMYQSNMSGISGYAGQLNPPPRSTSSVNLQYGPAPKYLMLANYQYTAFYGKISLTKDYVMNLHLYGLLGAGLLGVGDGSVPVLSIGLGQKFYFTPKFAFRFDLRGIAYNGPDPLSIPLYNVTTVVSNDKFDKTLQFGTLLSVGLIYLLPSF